MGVSKNKSKSLWNFVPVSNTGQLRKISPWKISPRHVDHCECCQLRSTDDHRQFITLSVRASRVAQVCLRQRRLVPRSPHLSDISSLLRKHDTAYSSNTKPSSFRSAYDQFNYRQHKQASHVKQSPPSVRLFVLSVCSSVSALTFEPIDL